MSDIVTVVGNGVAGYACAARLAYHGAAVRMIGPGLPHDRPPLSKRAIGTGRVPYFADAAKLSELGIKHVDGRVVQADLERRRLGVRPSGASDEIMIDAPLVVWATGFAYPLPPVPGVREVAVQNHDAGGLRTLAAAVARPGRRVVVIGAGLVGTETAASLGAAGHAVVLVDLLERPLSRLESVVGDAALTVLGDLGVTFLGGCAIESVEPGPTGTVVHTATHGDLRCDVLVTAAGFGSSLPEGLAPDARSLTVDVDETLRVIGHDALWACGDCVAFPHPRFGRIAIPHWDHAIHSGRHAADSVLGSSEPYVRDPYYFSDIGPLRVQQVGLASAVATWRDEAGLMVGRDPDGRVAAVLFLNAPARLNEARSMLATAG